MKGIGIRTLAIGAKGQGQTAMRQGRKRFTKGGRFIELGQNTALGPEGPVTANGRL
jgi:hypothetical protein